MNHRFVRQVRLAWHDSGTFDVNINEWPKAGGAIGSIRFSPEITHGANKGPFMFSDGLLALELTSVRQDFRPRLPCSNRSRRNSRL